MGRLALWVAALDLILLLLTYVLRKAGALKATAFLETSSAWISVLLVFLLGFLFLRWFRNYAMWRVRNRLIVTYLFIGGVPVALVALMALISGYFLAGQFATFLTLSEIHAQAERLRAANAAVAEDLVNRSRAGKPLRTEQLGADPALLPGITTSIVPESSRPAWLKDDFDGLTIDGNSLYLRAARQVTAGGRKLTVLTSVPVDHKFLAQIAAGVGPLDFYFSEKDNGVENLEIEEDRSITINGGASAITLRGGPSHKVSSDVPVPPHSAWDRQLTYLALTSAANWQTGQSSRLVVSGTTTLVTLYSRLSVSVSEWAGIVSIALAALAITFGVIVLAALIIGIRLTRTVTLSVANLYEATQHVNRGELVHRIQVKAKDQLGDLQVAFNSMMGSLEKLIAEQKEKERMQSELAIAQEVQAQLFPRSTSGTSTLEIHGVCRPARTVSGDYYDFLPYGEEQIGIAVGDISGKGISAALLMATIHSAVRAYEQDQLTAISSGHIPFDHARSGSVALATRQAPPQSASQVLWLLNRQLYKSTAPEKYATLFLSFYDGINRQLTYSNAGHLPPIILAQDGSVRRLECGGTVVGLFDNMEYEQATVDLSPGDIFVAFSDGIIEPENEYGEFGEHRLIETIESCRNLPLERITETVVAAVQDWIGSNEQPDDITLVLARPRA